jgi:hypothetical protein
MKKGLVRSLVATVAAGVATVGIAGTAVAAPTGEYADFNGCPYTSVTSCVYSKTTSGSIKLGNSDVPITSSTPIYLRGGIRDNLDGTQTWFNATGGVPTLSPTPLKVPGGLIGLVSTGGFTGFLIDVFNAAVADVNDVYATAELVGQVRFNLANIVGQTGEGVYLPVRVKLDNPFLGSGCYIGSASNPVMLSLTTGTTSPPPPATPISGTRGTLSYNDIFTVITATGVKLVNNSFAAPKASNCGYLPLDKLLITAGVNAKVGLPSPAGNNRAVLQGTTKVGNAAEADASDPSN